MIRVNLKIKNIRSMTNNITKNVVNGSFINQLNQKVVTEIKKFMLSGVSPVKGLRRFEKYKDKNNYPGDRKAARPVNLFLTGKMQSEIVASKKDSGFYIGISSLASEDVKTYAKANNVGTEKLPARRFVPIEGEQYNVSIMRKIKDIISKRIAELIKR